ncbi:MAG: hypothetical protein HY592_02420 [Candidatus Omnitrophica bacterium]|nr:hypothetical protein [Candidatus Omnitrophota bacterium]
MKRVLASLILFVYFIFPLRFGLAEIRHQNEKNLELKGQTSLKSSSGYHFVRRALYNKIKSNAVVDDPHFREWMPFNHFLFPVLLFFIIFPVLFFRFLRSPPSSIA